MLGQKKKDFASITAPLSKMVTDLEAYNKEQQTNEVNLNKEKEEIDKKIALSKEEQGKALTTAANLKSFMDPTKIVVTEDAVDAEVIEADELAEEEETSE